MNPRHGTPGTVTLPAAGFRRAKTEITSWGGYAPTPLRDLAMPGMVRFKDEAGRFGLGSFKVLGSAYAVVNLLADALARQNVAQSAGSAALAAGRYGEATQRITIASATDGNHGRAVAWTAARFHCRCVIYLHETVSAGRQAAIAEFGAAIRRVPGTYDDAVRACARDAGTMGWFIVSDTSWPGYTEVPRDIMQIIHQLRIDGVLFVVAEIAQQHLNGCKRVRHVIIAAEELQIERLSRVQIVQADAFGGDRGGLKVGRARRPSPPAGGSDPRHGAARLQQSSSSPPHRCLRSSMTRP